MTTARPILDRPAAEATNAVAALRRAVAERAGRADLLLLHVGDERFAVPLAASVEVVRLDASGALPTLRGGEVPLVRAADALGVAAGGEPRTAAVVRAAGDVLALAVDAAVPVHGVDLAGVRGVPWPDDGALLGVLPRGDTVVALVDVDALAALVAGRVHAAPPVPLHPSCA